MFGSPIRTTVFILVLFCTCSLVGLSLVKPRPVVQVKEVQAEVLVNQAWITVRCAHAPERIRLKKEGVEVVLDQFSPLEHEAVLEYHAGEVLQLELAWPEGTPETAALVVIEPDGRESLEVSYWGNRTLLREIILE